MRARVGLAKLVLACFVVGAFGTFYTFGTVYTLNTVTVAPVAVATATAATAARLVAVRFDFDLFTIGADGSHHLGRDKHVSLANRISVLQCCNNRCACQFVELRFGYRGAVVGALARWTRGALSSLATFRTLAALGARRRHG